MKNFVVLGPPGSGKDTQIEELEKYIDLQVLSAGDIARGLAEKNDKYRKQVEAGELLDDNIMLKEISKVIDKILPGKGIVFDGFPRNLHQAEVLNELLIHHGRNLDKVIYISLEEDVIVKRLTQRKICSICGHNIIPGTHKCSECGGRPVRRQDDEPAVIIKRVQTFLENTLQLVNYYRNRGIMLEVDGNQSIIKVAKDIKEGLGNDGK
jgi:adenylate kinase